MKTNSFKLLLVNVLLLAGISVISNSAYSQGGNKENRNVGTFSSINLSISADVFLSQGNKNELIIEADKDVLEKIITEVNDNTLDIEFEKWYNHRGNSEINIYITTKNIEKLTISGSGDIITKTPVNASDLGLVVTGSGSIIIDNLNTQDVKSIISGSGDIQIKGNSKAKSIDAVITGSGDIDFYQIEFESAELTITGSGTIMAKVLNELEASVTGSGKIYYKGKPIINADITGSGKIVNDN